MPEWLTILSAASLCLAGLCAIIIAADIFSGHRQKMWIMDVVWPVTALIFGHELDKAAPIFWFMMQIAMLCGFITAFPVNWWLLRKGVKEPM